MDKKILLHVCCAPCSIVAIDELKRNNDLTVFFFNPNIYPEVEYLKRKSEVVKICEEWKIPMVDFDYLPENWNRDVRGLENEPEMGARCPVCVGMRLREAAEYASENGFEVFATSLTMGRNKKAEMINPIGSALADKFVIKFFEIDWKKAGRQDKANKMVSDRGIYRQNYCGCKYSKK